MKKPNWQEAWVEDGDKVVCARCGNPHTLVQGKLNGIRMGEAILFYKCGTDNFIGAVNHKTILGVNVHEAD